MASQARRDAKKKFGVVKGATMKLVKKWVWVKGINHPELHIWYEPEKKENKGAN